MVAGLWLYGSTTGGDDSSPSPSPSDSAPEVFSSDRDLSSPGDIRVQARASRCIAVASEARIYVLMALRNYSGTAGSIDIIPVRRYSDGTTNDSLIDTLTAELGPRERRTFRNSFDYNAVEHDLLECWLRVVSTGKEIPIDAEQAY